MTIRVQRFVSSHEFLDKAESFLLEDELANSLMLGAVTAVARQTTSRRRHRPVYELVEDAGEAVLAAAWTQPQKILLSGHQPVSDHALEQLMRHLSLEPGQPTVIFGPIPVAEPFARLWADAHGQRVQTGMEQRLFALHRVIWPDDTPDGSLHPATVWNRELLGAWVAAFQTEAVPAEATDLETALLITDRLLMDDNLYIWLAAPDGGEMQPVSMAARARPTQTGVAVNLVYTPPEFRRQGYATATVAHLSQHLLNDGWQFCTLFTDLANPTSNHIYETIGYTPVMDFTEYRLLPAI